MRYGLTDYSLVLYYTVRIKMNDEPYLAIAKVECVNSYTRYRDTLVGVGVKRLMSAGNTVEGGYRYFVNHFICWRE